MMRTWSSLKLLNNSRLQLMITDNISDLYLNLKVDVVVKDWIGSRDLVEGLDRSPCV
jgi:hypothetical protein